MENKLFAVMLGGNPPGTGVEIHDVVFTVGPTLEATRSQMMAAWFAPGKAPHVDSWMELDTVDGARITLTRETVRPGEPDLWHVNLGYYEAGPGCFREGHENVFVVAGSAEEAKARAKELVRTASMENLHTDGINRVSDRLAAAGQPFRVKVVTQGGAGAPVAHDGYLPFADGHEEG
jgi:hypothetical protein